MFEIAALGVGGLFFWPALLAVLVTLAYFAENDQPGVATIVLLAFGAFLQFCTSFQPFTLILANPFAALGLVGGYLVLGIFYGIAKWWSYVRELRDRYQDARDLWLANRSLTEDALTSEQRAEMVRAAQYQAVGDKSLPPRVREHKTHVIAWMAYWPVSAAWTLLNDPVRRLFRMVYRYLAESLQSISDNIFSGFSKDFGK